MELKLKIHSKNTFPKGGIFIKSASPEVWLHEIQNIGLKLESVKVYPVPGAIANELYGCLLVLNKRTDKVDIRGNNFLQLIENKLFIPENTTISPELTKEEWHTLFSDEYHFLHPEIGLVELKDQVEWTTLLQQPEAKEIKITEPSKTVYTPQFISSLRVEVDKEKILENIENPPSEEEMIEKLPFDMQKVMKGNQKEMDKFMAFLDKNPKLALQYAIPLDTLGTSRGDNYGKFSFGSGGNVFQTGFAKIGDFFDRKSGSSNQSHGLTMIFRLIFILLFISSLRSCSSGKSSFSTQTFFVCVVVIIIIVLIIALLSKGKSSENGSGSASGGSFMVDSQRFTTLQSKYEKLAEEFIAKGDYQKAAHIYLKLLKNYQKAAEVLEKGELYPEAAAIYLKYCKNKLKAAECYEKGHAYKEAIEIYKELNNDEKVGDLYVILKDRKEANKHFRKVIESYKENFQYVKASLVYRDKIEDITEAQELLIVGWRTNKDAGRCLNVYFANIKSAEDLAVVIPNIYENEVNSENAVTFLHLLKHEFSKNEMLEAITKNIAYEIVADRIDEKPDIASELLSFNSRNKSMLKDVMKYKIKIKGNV
jgi:tetratricopeptide (TPR) repeat protein